MTLLLDDTATAAPVHTGSGLIGTDGGPQVERMVDVLRLLADKTRLNLLVILSRGERNVTSLCDELRLPQPTVSHHLGLLRLGGLLASRRSGKQIYYQLTGRAEPMADGAVVVRTDGMSVPDRVPAAGGTSG
jgi:DNA-binding transcriptional ArsR family regulator